MSWNGFNQHETSIGMRPCPLTYLQDQINAKPSIFSNSKKQAPHYQAPREPIHLTLTS
jgi:hypothetical protein